MCDTVSRQSCLATSWMVAGIASVQYAYCVCVCVLLRVCYVVCLYMRIHRGRWSNWRLDYAISLLDVYYFIDR